MATLSYEIDGKTASKPFGDAAAAMHFAVRLVQTPGNRASKVRVLRPDGTLVFSHEEIANLSRQVRLT